MTTDLPATRREITGNLPPPRLRMSSSLCVEHAFLAEDCILHSACACAGSVKHLPAPHGLERVLEVFDRGALLLDGPNDRDDVESSGVLQ